MDIALARKSGQELQNDYVITDSPDFDQLRLFFRTAVRELFDAYLNFPGPVYTSSVMAPARGDRLRGIARVEHDCPSRHTSRQDPEEDITETERLLDTLRLSPTLPTSSVVTTTAGAQSPVEQMTDLLSSESDRTQLHALRSKGAVSKVSLASTNLLSHVEPLPFNQLICHSVATVRSWPTTRREDLIAVAYRDMAVARRNMAELTRYLDIHSTHIAACSGALDDNLPMMSAEIFPRLTGGIPSALDETDQSPEEPGTD